MITESHTKVPAKRSSFPAKRSPFSEPRGASVLTSSAILVLGNANVDLVLGEVDRWPAIGTEVVVERSEMRAGGSAGTPRWR